MTDKGETNMTDLPKSEATEMMQRCKAEIVQLRDIIDRLRPKADAYDNIAAILALLPKRGGGISEDLVWQIDKRIAELQKPTPPTLDGKPISE